MRLNDRTEVQMVGRDRIIWSTQVYSHMIKGFDVCISQLIIMETLVKHHRCELTLVSVARTHDS